MSTRPPPRTRTPVNRPAGRGIGATLRLRTTGADLRRDVFPGRPPGWNADNLHRLSDHPADSNTYGDPDPHCDPNAHHDRDTHGDADAYCHSDTYGDADAYRDRDTYIGAVRNCR